MQEYIIPLILVCAFVISPIMIIRLLLRYTSKNPKHTVHFQFKIPGCNINLSMSDSDESEQPRPKVTKLDNQKNATKVIYYIPAK